ncbi:MAG: HAMP domain-containing sensor histidine kinase [Gemmatimonadaceae bacterium]
MRDARNRIRLRLTAMYAASICVVLLATLFVGRAIFRRAVRVEFERSVDGAVTLIQGFFRAELSEYRQVDATLAHISGELVFVGIDVTFVQPNGTPFPYPVKRNAPTLREPVEQFEFPLERQLAPNWRLRVRASADQVARLNQQIDLATLVGLPAVVAVAAIFGWFITGRTLRPVGRMADAAERIHPGTASRLPVDDPSDELGRLGVRFNAVLDRLDGALAQQRHFLADAAHELRTPIARIRGELEVAMLDDSDPVATQAVLRRTQLDVARVSVLVDELLQLARADAGEPGAVLEPAFLDDVVTDALRPWFEVARRDDRVLEIGTLGECRALIDPTRIDRLVAILVDNAVRYTKAGGHIVVSVACEGESAVLTVDDDGIGIPESERERVFGRFVRGSAARLQSPAGSGLGLSIASSIAQAHHARIEATASPLGGARLRVVFPVAPFDTRVGGSLEAARA